jgi:glycosyltransferase involved in cell wall biosynthesis
MTTPMNNMPQISVIIPTYNNGQYISQTLDSVLSQDYPSFEVIVVDDGSTDNTPQILEPYYKQIQYVRQPNAGPSAARNHGLSLASGEHVVFLDADDLMLPGKLAQQAAMLSEQPHLGYIHSGWKLVDQNGELIDRVEPWQYTPQLDLEHCLKRPPAFLGAIMIRRHWLDRAGGFDPTLSHAEDVKLFLELAFVGCPADWLYQPTVCYRQHDSSLTRNGLPQAEGINRVMADFFARPDLPPRIQQMENEIRYYTLMWGAWKLYSTGHPTETTPYLRQSLTYIRKQPSLRTVQQWLGYLIIQCRNHENCDLQRLIDLWPCFKAAIQVDEAYWGQIERALNWLLHAEIKLQARQAASVNLQM